MHTTTASHIIPALPPPPHFAPRYIKGAQSAILTGFIFLAVLSSANAADFSGKLKGVSITDAQAVNKPPVAAFTYAQSGDALTFDATGSSDPDGNITKYKWDFGNGVFAEGATASHTILGTDALQVTLTVVDNNNGAALTQQIISLESKNVADTFSSDSSLNYTAITGAITVSDGAAHGKQWNTSRVFHSTPLQTSEHYVEADVQYSGGTDSGGLLARVDATSKTCYIAFFSGGKIALARFNGSTQAWMADYNGNYTSGTYKMRLETVGNSIKVYVNGTITISKTDTTYSDGKHIGMYFNRGNNIDIFVDNLTSGSI